MGQQRNQETETTITLRLWTYRQAVNALLYLRAVVQSVREHWLDLQQARRHVRGLDARPGRPDRRALVLRAEADREGHRAEDALEEALDELKALDVFCVDPLHGVALIPFAQGEDLAWFVFDLFAPWGLDGWRFHGDPPKTRRPLPTTLAAGEIDQVFSSQSFTGLLPQAG